MKFFTIQTFFALVLASLAGGCVQERAIAPAIQLYAMDCGSIDVDDMKSFSVDGAFAGQSYALVVPCYLIRHAEGDVIWDTGFDQSLADMPGGISGGGFHSSMSARLTDQLQELGLDVNDIEFLAVSHSHPDHAGNAGLFKNSTFIISAAEHAYMFSDEARDNAESFKAYAPLEDARTIQFDDEHDVFGDGRVVIKKLPGHTPGSAVLLLRLTNAGPQLLTGDLITHSAGRRLGAVPVFNTDIEQTRRSIAAFEALAEAQGARVIIQHEPKDFEALPAFPAWLD